MNMTHTEGWTAEHFNAHIAVEMYKLQQLLAQHDSLVRLCDRYPDRKLPATVASIACEVYAESIVGVESIGGVLDAIRTHIKRIWDYLVEYTRRYFGQLFNNNPKIQQLIARLKQGDKEIINAELQQRLYGIDSLNANEFITTVDFFCEGLPSITETLWNFCRPYPKTQHRQAPTSIADHPVSKALAELHLSITQDITFEHTDKHGGKTVLFDAVAVEPIYKAEIAQALARVDRSNTGPSKAWTADLLIVNLSKLIPMNAQIRNISEVTLKLANEATAQLADMNNIPEYGKRIALVTQQVLNMTRYLGITLNRELVAIATQTVSVV